jgi:hypothetical protein
MKNILYTAMVLMVLTGVLSSCYKTCEDPFAPNYTLEGSCIDLTAGITGVYNGQLTDSIVGLHSTNATATLVITKVDDSHVSVSSSASSFVGFSAVVNSAGNGYLTIPSQTAGNGLTVVGAGTYFGNGADGIYISAEKQLSIYALAGTQYEGFTGTQQ